MTDRASIDQVAFLGTPEVAAISLRHLIGAGITVTQVVTAPPKRRGRGSAALPTPVELVANEAGIAVAYDPIVVIESGARLGIVVAYGSLLRAPVLGSMPLLNLHFSLLPRWRGAAPVERAILAGDERVGVSVMEIEAGLDTGPVYACTETTVDDKTLAGLWSELADLGSTLLVQLLHDGLGVPVPQSGASSHAAKLDKMERFVDPGIESAELSTRRVRLGGAWSEVRGQRLGIGTARRVVGSPPFDAGGSQAPGLWVGGVSFAAADGSILELVEVQPPGKRMMPAADWARGLRLGVGDRLGHA